jgi:hypothetical protein
MSSSTHTPKLSRREALKALSAASGAILTAAMLPDKWAKPVVGSGVLPAHAQASRTFMIESCEIYQNDSAPANSRCFIDPVEQNISLNCVWIYQPYTNSNPTVPQPNNVLTALTDEFGKAFVTLPFNWSDPEPLWGLITCTWSFTNPQDGTDTCSVEQVVDNRPR